MGEPQEPRPQGQQMRGRCEVPHQGGKAEVGAGRPCDVNVGRPRSAGGSPAPLRSVICQVVRGWYSARPALIYTFPALPLSLLGPGKRVVTFAVNNEFWQVPLISPLLQPPPWFPGGAGLLHDPWARAAERKGSFLVTVFPGVRDTERAALQQKRPQALPKRVSLLGSWARRAPLRTSPQPWRCPLRLQTGSSASRASIICLSNFDAQFPYL